MSKAKYIAIDGVDGSGKTTQATALVNELINKGFKCKFIKFTAYASIPMRKYALLMKGEEAAMRTIFSLSYIEYIHACEQYLNYINDVEPYINQFDYIIQDRSKISRLVNADYANTPLDEIKIILEQFPSPDIIICLDIDPDVALNRILKRGPAAADETMDYLVFATKSFLRFSEEYPETYILNGRSEAELVKSEILKILKL